MDEVQAKKTVDQPAEAGDDAGEKVDNSNLGLGFSDFTDILKLNQAETDSKPSGGEKLSIERGDESQKDSGRKGNQLELKGQPRPGEDYLNLPDSKALLELLTPKESSQERDGKRAEEPPKISIVPGFDQSKLPTGGDRGPKPQFPFMPDTRAPGNFYNRDNTTANRFEQGFKRFLSDPAVQNRIGTFLDNPEIKRGITEVVQRVGAEMGVNIDAQKGEVNLNMDFASLYDRSVPRDSADYSPEVRTMLSNLENVNLSADRVNMKFRSEQVISMGDKGIAAQYKLATGADNGRTSMDVDTTESTLSLKNIKGMQVVERSGRRLDIHQINLDSSNPDDPKGSITMDNPLPRPKFLPESVPWPETVTVPLMIPQDQKAEMAEKLPTTIKTMDAIRAGAKSGDLTETLKRVSLADLNQMLGWSFKNRGSIDFQSAWRPPSMRSLYEQGADKDRRDSGPRPGAYDPRVRK